ncbi:cbb3-type cytochrome c oxidase subunit II [Pelagicoccus sp. SDUM812003]|uniref:cbb3-type cytochrome c oxidase subunit II n=1 Tax=Pelagicoccus sp. SDUM812003 TaxID=3041267 RepID=UPI0028100AFF|nr:cbb3-type cytochrome c oxidase subunit II [Pelagicoccus sp. SDUM812003]MDQ8202256.1 cbb3-type cytochrome c oxidase subunit II [Pelagicoccus sp. SDUM812003]
MKLVVTFAALALMSVFAARKTSAPVGSLELGKRVYVAEGCIHCHSQYSRPIDLDADLYGPAAVLPLQEGQSVLIGNRRQGPDLSSVGLRRSREWNRLHLIKPAAVTPGSRMPSYGYLFEGEETKGEALLDYLQSLKGANEQAWLRHRENWTPANTTGSGSLERGRRLFAEYCAQCHGSQGDGTGDISSNFRPSPADLRGDGYRFAPKSLQPELRRLRLQRIVKYGILGTSMPGHEYLTDQQVVDLVELLTDWSETDPRSR